MNLDYEYVAYIDEAGDDGLRRVRPVSNNGASEWLILAAVVVKKNRETEIKKWIIDLTSNFKHHQRDGVHFSDLNPAKRLAACEFLASKDLRIFVVASNKKNMQGYENPAAAQIPSQNWFYCWLTRLLLERVTLAVNSWSHREFGEPRKIRIEYSARGGLRYPQMAAYYEWMRMKKNQFLPWGKVYFDVMAFDLLKVYPHTTRAGLQLADIAASAFYKACDHIDTGDCDPRFAKALKPRMGIINDQIAGFGLKLMPSLSKANLLPAQEEIFRFYGYPKQWWDPKSFS